MTDDEAKARNPAADDDDVRVVVSLECRRGEHAACDGTLCDCDHHTHAALDSGQPCDDGCAGPADVACKCRACATEFMCTYDSHLCDACLDKPFVRPVGGYK